MLCGLKLRVDENYRATPTEAKMNVKMELKAKLKASVSKWLKGEAKTALEKKEKHEKKKLAGGNEENTLAGGTKEKTLAGGKEDKTTAKEVEDMWKGVKVRVVDERAGKHNFGLEGTVDFVKDGGQVQCTTLSGMKTFICGETHLEVIEGVTKRRPFKALTCTSKDVRQGWVWGSGFGDLSTSQEEWEAFQEDAMKDCPVMLWDGHLRLFQEWLLWSLSATVEVSMVPPAVVAGFVSSADGGAAEDIAKLRHALRSFCRRNAVVLVPIWSDVGGAPHWTLLVIDRGSKALRYYDSLKNQHPGNRAAAVKVWEEVKEEAMPEVVPEERAGAAIQGPAECGFFVCHWMEEEVRKALGEGGAAAGWPQAQGIRKKLRQLCRHIEA